MWFSLLFLFHYKHISFVLPKQNTPSTLCENLLNCVKIIDAHLKKLPFAKPSSIVGNRKFKFYWYLYSRQTINAIFMYNDLYNIRRLIRSIHKICD